MALCYNVKQVAYLLRALDFGPSLHTGHYADLYRWIHFHSV